MSFIMQGAHGVSAATGQRQATASARCRMSQRACVRPQQQRSAVQSLKPAKGRQLVVQARAERAGSSEGSFTAGFIIGGVVFGALGFLFAPQISKALLGDDQRLRLPRFMEDEVKDPEQTKQELIEKIAQLNASIDEVASQLKAKDDSTHNGATIKGELEGIKILA